VHLGAVLMQRLGHRVRNSAAHAAANHSHLAVAGNFGGIAQRAYKVLQAVAHLQPCQLLGGRAHQLEDNGHRTGGAIIVRHRQGDTLAPVVHPQDHKLAGLGFLCHIRRLNFHTHNSRVQHPLGNDFIHRITYLKLDIF